MSCFIHFEVQLATDLQKKLEISIKSYELAALLPEQKIRLYQFLNYRPYWNVYHFGQLHKAKHCKDPMVIYDLNVALRL